MVILVKYRLMPKTNVVLLFVALAMTCLGSNTFATSYQGISTTNPGAAIYFTGNQFAADTDSYTGFVTFGSGLVMPSSGTVTLGTMGRLDGSLAFAPIGGSTGILALSDDLECSSLFRIRGEASILGGGYSLRLTGSLTLDGSNRILPQTNCQLVIDGQGNTLTLAASEAISFANTVSVTLRNMTLVLADPGGLPIINTAADTTITLDNVKVIMSPAASLYTFTWNSYIVGLFPGRLCIENEVCFSGPGATFLYNSSSPLVICSGATLTFDSGTTFLYLAGDRNLLYMTDRTSTLRFNNCSVTVPGVSGGIYTGTFTTLGLQLLRGTLEFENQVFIENDGQSNVANGLTLGDGINVVNNVAVNVLSGANVIVDGCMYYNQA